MLGRLNAFLKYPSNAFVMKTKSAVNEATGRMLVKEKMCCICIEDYEVDNMNAKVLELSCGHLFHEECVTAWLSTKKSCPVCRERIRYIAQLVAPVIT